MSCSVENAVGEHTLFFVYNGEGEDDLMEIQSWQFTEKEPQPEVDKTALKEAIDKASEINSSEYTNASLEKLYEALEAAKDVYEDETAEQAAVDTAAADLNSAYDALTGEITNSELLNEVVKKYLETKGKQIRPIIVILSAKFFAEVNSNVLNGAAAIELLHNASLIHDDVVDETKVRRGNPTVNSIWNNHIAVLVGDFFVSNSLSCAIKAGDNRVIQVISELGKELSTGEIDQINIAKQHNINEENYYHIISKKTASLFRCCVQVGGYAVKADEADIENLAKFMELLGLCFQIKDDIFDYFKDEAVGKPTGNDLREGKITLPLIYALAQDTPQRDAMVKLAKKDELDTDEIETLIEYAKAQGGIEYAYESMERLRREAIATIEKYPDNEAKDSFLSLFDFIIKRHH